ncbi:hypothetical protein [Gordonia sp. CNJ-863]|uniref:hypothetical protein n=1 Tax=Gordonia sp. CNJ-863 TaxID=1904963 RepID=UPI001115194F|nr:hypothetical protein [Gordonia sp. CNJ-863]
MARLGGDVRIDYYDFPIAPNLRTINVTEAALDRAAIGVGNLNAFMNGAPSTVKAIAAQWRTAITRDTVHLAAGEWRRAIEYDSLERTEKGFLSGLLGGVIGKLVAESVFQVRQFGHIEYFTPPPRFDRRTRRRPDFLGLPANSGDPAVVVESKGRSNYFGGHSGQVEQAKQQVRSVLSVPGWVAVHRYVQYTHFNNGVLVVDLYDPPGPDGSIPVDDAPGKSEPRIDLRSYYRDVVDAAVALQAPSVELGGSEYRMITYGLLDIAVGVPERIYQAILEDRPLLVGSSELAQVNKEDVASQSELWWHEVGIVRDSRQVISDVGLDGIAVVGSYPRRG